MRLEMRRALPLLIAYTLAPLAFSQSVQEIARVGLSSTVTVIAYGHPSGDYSTGSGFLVAPNLVLTNHHVIEGQTSMSVFLVGSSREHLVEAVVLRDAELDLALLAVNQPLGPVLELREGNRPEIGETVYAIGSPLGLEGTFTQGIVSSYRPFSDMTLMQITAPISPGSSGGPVLDSNGRVAGVVVATMSEGQNLNFAIPVALARAFLARQPAPVSGQRVSTDGQGSDSPLPSPSFDCELAESWSERAICSSAYLAQLDVRLADAYSAVRSRVSDARFTNVRLDQRAWLAGREACEAQPVYLQEICLADYTQARIDALDSHE